jgi:chromosome segregation ATPase
LEQVKNNNADDIKGIEDRIKQYEDSIESDNVKKLDLSKKHSKKSSEMKDLKAKVNALKDVPSMIVKLETLKTNILEDLQSLEGGSACKCCGQKLPEDQWKKHKAEKQAKSEELFSALKTARKKMDELEKHNKSIEELDKELDVLTDDINALSYTIGNSNSKYQSIAKRKERKRKLQTI